MKWFLVLLSLVVVATCERQRFDGCDIWKLKPKTEKQLTQLHNYFERHDDDSNRELIFWEEPRFVDHEVEVLVCPSAINDLKYFLGYSRINGQIIQYNIQRQLDAVWAESDMRHAQAGIAYNPLAYNTFDDILDYLQQLYDKCPVEVKCILEDIGTSYEGRPLRAFRMIQEDNTRGIWVDSLIHSREWLAGTTVLGIMSRLVNEYGSNPDVTRLVDNYNWHFVPVVNPDGYVYTWTNNRMWRKTRSENEGTTCMGTDANRNFDYMWGTPGASGYPCSDIYRGPRAASEPETIAIQQAGEALRDELVLLLTFHSTGEYYLFPYGTVDGLSCMKANNQDDLQRIGDNTIRAIQNTYNRDKWVTGPTCSTLYAASGSTCDWAHGVGLVKYSFTPELRGPGFNPDPSNITPSIEENWNGLLVMIQEIEDIEGF